MPPGAVVGPMPPLGGESMPKYACEISCSSSADVLVTVPCVSAPECVRSRLLWYGRLWGTAKRPCCLVMRSAPASFARFSSESSKSNTSFDKYCSKELPSVVQDATVFSNSRSFSGAVALELESIAAVHKCSLVHAARAAAILLLVHLTTPAGRVPSQSTTQHGSPRPFVSVCTAHRVS